MAPFRLVVVESSAKIAKVSKYLGPGFKVVATLGHFRDLPDDELGVDTATWALRYVPLASKPGVVSRLKEAAQGAVEVLLATDADREGEAISWHVATVLGLRDPKRVRFREITPRALQQAVTEASPLDLALVDAQQARRVIDRLVGYSVSPLLKAFGSGHSAGRVQSPTLQVVVKREQEREAFVAVPFWTLTVHYDGFAARAAARDEKGLWHPRRFESAAAAAAAEAEAKAARHLVEALDTARGQVRPKPPFTTSTMQQAASAQLGFEPKQTMALAQALFEKGVITYHRTDSVSLSEDGIALARSIISGTRPDVLPETAPRYRNGAEAQEAHEAIRPTAARVDAETQLSGDEEVLLNLINRRFLASQCKPAVVDRTTVRVQAGELRLLAAGDVLVFDGFRAFLDEDEDDSDPELAKDATSVLPPLVVRQQLLPRKVEQRGEKTQPPPRFTQATLVKEMTRLNIGRPATLEPTISTLFERAYLGKEKKAVIPTPRGRVIANALAASFPELTEPRFTAAMEERLDGIAAGRGRWKQELTKWYRGFEVELLRAPSALRTWLENNREWVASCAGASAPRPTGKKCPRCSGELLAKEGKNGAFLACAGYPACTYSADPSVRPSKHLCPKCSGPTEEVDGRFGVRARCLDAKCDGRVDAAAEVARRCPACAGALKDRGEFLGCSNYPTCRCTIDKAALARAEKRNRRCAKCGGLLLERKGQRGKFLGCIAYPKCRHVEEVPSMKRGAQHA